MTDPGAGGAAPVAARRATERRRSLQPLWNGLAASLLDTAHAGGGALLAVSGGFDSRALLEAAARWPRRFDLRLEVASVDHGTRPESHDEADAVAARARALGFTAAVLTVDDGGRNEADWRALRYAALVEHARRRGLAAIAVAHHEGDQAENALLGLVGAGGGAIAGVIDDAGSLHGAAPAAGAGPVRVVRPFVALARAQLREALSACGVAGDAFADPDAGSARARLRRTLLAPLLSARADVEERLARHARAAADDDAALRDAAAALVSVDDAVVRVARSERPALVRRALRQALAEVWRRGTPGGAAVPDPRDAAAAVDTAAALIHARRAGHVDVARAAIEVDAAGAARIVAQVADGPATTHDGWVRRQDNGEEPGPLSVVRPVPILGASREPGHKESE